jgi:hypothetical protein
MRCFGFFSAFAGGFGMVFFADSSLAGLRQFRLLLLGEERVKDGCGGLLPVFECWRRRRARFLLPDCQNSGQNWYISLEVAEAGK